MHATSQLENNPGHKADVCVGTTSCTLHARTPAHVLRVAAFKGCGMRQNSTQTIAAPKRRRAENKRRARRAALVHIRARIVGGGGSAPVVGEVAVQVHARAGWGESRRRRAPVLAPAPNGSLSAGVVAGRVVGRVGGRGGARELVSVRVHKHHKHQLHHVQRAHVRPLQHVFMQSVMQS